MKKDYYLHARKGGIYYVEFVSPVTGKKMTAKSTGGTNLFKAHVKAELMKSHGIPIGNGSIVRPLSDMAGADCIMKTIRKTDLTEEEALKITSLLKEKGLVDVRAVGRDGRGAAPFARFLAEFYDYDRSEYIRDRLAHGHRYSRRHAYACLCTVRSRLAPFFGKFSWFFPFAWFGGFTAVCPAANSAR